MLELKRNELIGYAMSFVSFFMERLERERIGIKNIVLFGSAVTGNVERESDIDIFVNVLSDQPELDKKISGIQDAFFQSHIYKGYWKLLGIKNSFHVIVDSLEKYELKESIISQGIILYGKYIDIPRDYKPRTIIYWRNVKPENKRVNLHRKLFGYSFRNKRYEGMLERYKGQLLSSGSILVDSETEKAFLDVFRIMKIPVRIKKIIELG